MCAFAPKTAIVFGIGLVSKLVSTLSIINDQCISTRLGGRNVGDTAEVDIFQPPVSPLDAPDVDGLYDIPRPGAAAFPCFLCLRM